MNEFPWGGAFLGALAATLVVDSSYGRAVPAWVKMGLNTAWLVLMGAVIAGLPLAYFNELRMELPNGGYKIAWQMPGLILAICGAAILGALVFSVIGLLVIARSPASREACLQSVAAFKTWVSEVQWTGVGVGALLMLLGAVLACFGGPLAITANGLEGGLKGGIGIASMALVITGIVKAFASLKKGSDHKL